MRRSKSSRRNSSSQGPPQAPENAPNEGAALPGTAKPGGTTSGTDRDTDAKSRKGSGQSDLPAPILSTKHKTSSHHRHRHRKKSVSSADTAEKAAEPKADASATLSQQVPAKGETAGAQQPSTDMQTAITSGIGQYLQSLLPTKQPTVKEELAPQPASQQVAATWPPQAMPLMPMTQQALAQQMVPDASIHQQQPQYMPPMSPYLPQPQFSPQSFPPIPQAVPYAYGGMIPPWYGLPQQIPLGQAPLSFLPPSVVQPTTTATGAPVARPEVPPSIAASSAASSQPEAARPPEPKQAPPTTVTDTATVAPAAVTLTAPTAKEAKVTGTEAVSDGGLQGALDSCKISPPYLSEPPSIVHSPKPRSSHRHHSRRHVALDQNAIDNTSPTMANFDHSFGEVPKKHRSNGGYSHHKSLQYDDRVFDESSATEPGFATDHRGRRERSVYSKGDEDQVDEQTDDITSPVSAMRHHHRSKGKSRSRSAKPRKSDAAAPELAPPPSSEKESVTATNLSRNGSNSSGTAATPAGPTTTPASNVSGVDKEVLKKLVDALSTRRKATSTGAYNELDHKGKCHYRRGHVKGKHQEMKEKEQDNSENFFEEIVEEIVQPEKDAKGAPQKRLVRKTTKMRTHNVIEEPWWERGETDGVPLVDRVEAMRSLFHKPKTSPSERTRLPRGDIGEDDYGVAEIASWGSERNQSSSYLRRITSDEDNGQADSDEYESVSSPFRPGQRYFKRPFPRQQVPPWYRAPFSPRYSPGAARMIRPYRLPRPMPCFECAALVSRFPRAQFNRNVCPVHTFPLNTCPNAGAYQCQRSCCNEKLCDCVQDPELYCPGCQNATLATNQCVSTVLPPSISPASTTQARRQRRAVYRSCPPPPNLPVIDNTCYSTAPNLAGGPYEKGAPCDCCPYGAGMDDLARRQVSLEEVLRHEDNIRWDARLEDRRRLLDEERIREEERLAFRESLAQQKLVLNERAGPLHDAKLQEFKEALQRELAKRRESKTKLEAARSQASGSVPPKVATPSSEQAQLGTEEATKEPTLPGALKPDSGKPGTCASRRTSRPSIQLGTARRTSFAPVLKTTAGPAQSSAAGMDATEHPPPK